VPAVLAGGS